MSVLPHALVIRRTVEESATLRLLRSDNLPLAAAILSTYLNSPGTRIDTEELHERIDADLTELRPHLGLSDVRAKVYCDQWRSSGIIIRRPATAGRGETYELSAEGFDALRILDNINVPQVTVTESRLVTLTQALHQLALDTDPDTARRIQALELDRDRINDQIARLQAGEAVPTLTDLQSRERIADILHQAQAMPADFARVRARFSEINQQLRAQILADTTTASEVLDKIFDDIDLIESSDEGRTFTAFSSFIRDPERSATFDDDVAAILDRDFAHNLPLEVKHALRGLVRSMKDGSRDVQTTLTDLARGLRRYVYSQEFESDRVLRAHISAALHAAIPASTVIKPYEAVGVTLERPTLHMSSVGELTLHDPTDFNTGDPLTEASAPPLDLETLKALTRESEIDFAELIDNVNALFAATDPGAQPTFSIAEVLAAFPASQGVASVVGLMSLAVRHGLHSPGEAEVVSWVGEDTHRNRVRRQARIERYEFIRQVVE